MNTIELGSRCQGNEQFLSGYNFFFFFEKILQNSAVSFAELSRDSSVRECPGANLGLIRMSHEGARFVLKQ